MYYQAFEQKIPSEAQPWNQNDELFVSLLFSRAITRSAIPEAGTAVLQIAMSQLLDMCLYLSKDAKDC
ncbi:hypothetical protein SAMN02745704_02456 [Paucidesulfovibrio gracilis DSM 16080]|uniref:Uncharacterized protein n=1 Tax=Paucidesulfovibrio gracilis DSM 16080 TaxID=1121449 RepID=A0A1T4XU72_9BACT|nr:hypothetical protein [Paucidesulfovibrio gracilis]SKA92953.1 hypothetical protein SAMN02745704_02456 [Paucidesulfovibrio gracilis DSM 16080]